MTLPRRKRKQRKEQIYYERENQFVVKRKLEATRTGDVIKKFVKAKYLRKILQRCQNEPRVVEK